MPYYPQAGPGILGQLVGAAAQYYDTREQMQNEALNRQYESQRMSTEAQQAQTAAQQAALQQEWMPKLYQSQLDTDQAALQRTQIETQYYRDQIAHDTAISNIRPPTKILAALAQAQPNSPEETKLFKQLGTYYYGQGDTTTGDSIMQHTQSFDSSLYRTSQLIPVANIGAQSRDYAAQLGLQRGVDVANIGAQGRVDVANIAGGFKEGVARIQAGAKTAGQALTAWTNVNKDMATRLFDMGKQNDRDHAAGNDLSYPNLPVVNQSAMTLYAAMQQKNGTTKQAQGNYIKAIDSNPQFNDNEKSFLRSIVTSGVRASQIEQKAQSSAQNLQNFKLPDLSGLTGGGSNDTQNPNRYSLDDFENAWVRQGGDPSVAPFMARVAYAESAGSGHATNHYKDSSTGKTYTVRGPWQISSIHGGGDEEYNIDKNAARAVELFNAQGLRPWLDSRYKGAGGGWNQYLYMLPGLNQ